MLDPNAYHHPSTGNQAKPDLGHQGNPFDYAPVAARPANRLGQNGYPPNITLIGMFGSGKSTVARLMAKRLRYHVVDVDHVIEHNFKKSLQKVLDDLGIRKFMAMEDQTLRTLKSRRCVIAPGGSAVYYPIGMKALQKMGPLVYLKVSLVELKRRLPDWSSRGVVCRGGSTLPVLFRERSPLYRQYADITVDANGQNWDKMAEAALKGVVEWHLKNSKRK